MIKSKLNQLGNSKNPYQGTTVKALCICSAGLLRSPTIAKYLTGLGYNTRAVGIAEDYALVPLSTALVSWSDEIHVVKEQHMSLLQELLFEGIDYNLDKIYVYDIPDSHGTFSPELEAMIDEQFQQFT
jgi:predicted protein tyrosine phosphatase